MPCVEPTVLLTDNKANMLVANDAGSSVRSRHFLRMYRLLQQRIGGTWLFSGFLVEGLRLLAPL